MSGKLRKIFSYQMLVMLLIGYSAGLPLLLIGSTLQAWMTDAGLDLATIGLISIVGVPYSLKFLWSPFLDRYELPILGRRRGWILVFQLLLVVSLFSMSFLDPRKDLTFVSALAFLIAFLSASQDIVLDAYRREILPDEELGLGNSLYITGYRLAIIVSGALALRMADSMEWGSVYKWMSLCMAPAILFTIVFPKENSTHRSPTTITEAVIGPLREFFLRPGAWIILLFILLYKAGDTMAANMTTPFILKLGYSKTQMGDIAKLYGMLATILGGIVGGIFMLRINMKWSLICFGILQAVSTLGFALLPSLPITFGSLALVIAFENLASGMGTAAYAGYMASLTNRQFTATQYALFSALMGVPRTILAGPTGWFAEQMGWEVFFVFCTLVALPGMLLLILVFRLENSPEKSAA
jgi:PAT family beta-lactamase induction signal transducer AmpG